MLNSAANVIVRALHLVLQNSVLPNRLRSAITIVVASLFFTSGESVNAEPVHYSAAMNYRLHCEGCHQSDGSGQPGYIPAFENSVAAFLSTSEGRTYLARVPGISQSLLSDEERAEVLTWIVNTFDPEHVPSDFVPYSALELSQWRYNALSQPSVVRAQLVAALDSGTVQLPAEQIPLSQPTESSKPGNPPAAITICLACHTVAAEGGSGVGPNLYGILGKRVGTVSGFSYSSAMRNAGFVWTDDKLDDFLKGPAEAIPGNFMSLGGIESVEERRSIIDYLKTLR